MAEDEAKQHRTDRRIIFILALALPFFLVVGRELVRGELIFYMRAVDFADIFILAPLYTIVLIFLWNYMWLHSPPKLLLAAFAIFGVQFMYGHAMHATANAINTLATEVRDYRDLLPDDLYQLIYFLDEELSHVLLFVAVTGLIGCWLIFDRMALAEPLFPRSAVLVVGLGLLWGIVKAYGHIEARTVWLMFPIALVLMALWYYLWRKSALSFRDYFWDRPFTTFVAIMLLFGISTLIIWGVIFNGFPQPSEIGL